MLFRSNESIQYFGKKIDINLNNIDQEIDQKNIKEQIYNIIEENNNERKKGHESELINKAETTVAKEIKSAFPDAILDKIIEERDDD